MAVSVANDEVWSPEVDALARRIAGEKTDLETLHRARAVAEAQIDLARVRSHRKRIIERTHDDPEFRTAEKQKFDNFVATRFGRGAIPAEQVHSLKRLIGIKPVEAELRIVAVLEALSRELGVVDRYERRALSRRKSAIRAFDAWVVDERGAREKSSED